MNVHCIYQLSGKKNLFLLSTRFAQWKWKLRIISNFQTMKAAMKSYNSRASYSYFCASIYLFKNLSFFSRDEMVYFWFDNYLVFIDSSVNYRILLFVDKTSWFVMLHCCFIYHFPPKKKKKPCRIGLQLYFLKCLSNWFFPFLSTLIFQ